MANHSLPTLSSTYSDFLTSLDERIEDASKMFEGSSYSNQPTGAKRYNTSTNVFETWSGSAWATVQISYAGLSFGSIAGLKTDLGLSSLAYLASVNNSNWAGTALSLGNGGTGATSASAARTALGLGTIAVQPAAAVVITGGTIAGMTSIAGTAISAGTVTTGTVVSDSGSNLAIKAPTGQTLGFSIGATEKIGMPSAVTSGSPALTPGANLTYTFGNGSLCFTEGWFTSINAPSGQDVSLKAASGQAINMSIAGSIKWQVTSAGKLTSTSSPAYSNPFTYTTTRSLDPAAATATTNANAINTIIADLKALGPFA